jgi:hypothetical protein
MSAGPRAVQVRGETELCLERHALAIIFCLRKPPRLVMSA